MSQRTMFLFAATAVLAMVYLLLTRSSLREKYAAFWLMTSGLLFVFALFPGFVSVLGRQLSFEATSNFVFGVIILLILSLVMLMSLEVGRLEDKIQILAEENALHAQKLKDLYSNEN